MSNLLSEHNRILRVGEGGGGIEYSAGPNIDITNHVISGRDWSDDIGDAVMSGISSTSGDIVNEAYNQSTAWVDEQGYLTAHQDVTNLPYVQNSALEFSPQGLISGISGSGIYATSAENAFTADTAYFAYNAEHADSADFVATANFANSASSALNAEVANVAYTALTAQFLDGGWELDVDGFITAYNNSAFAGAGGGGRYEGISPIVVNNEEMRISAKSALLGVQDPLYFVEDSETATVIGIHDSAFPTFEGTPDGKISAINGSALNADPVVDYSAGNNIDITDHIISVTGSVPSADRADYAVSATSSHFSHSAIEAGSANYATESNHTHSADSATYDNLGREIASTYLTAEVEYSAGDNINITNHVVSGKDWSSEISDASANAVNEAINTITAVASAASATYDSDGNKITETYISAHQDVSNLPYVQNSALEYSPGGHLVSSISGDALYAMSADCAFTAETANYSYVAETANYVADGWEYNESNEITGYSGSAIHSEAGGEGKVYTGVAPIVVDNSQTTGVISAQTARLGVQSPLYFVEDTSASTVIGISGDLTGQYIPYTATGTNEYLTNSALTISANNFITLTTDNTGYQNEAHVHVHQKSTPSGSLEWYTEIDGADYGHIHQHWFDSTGGETAMLYEKNGLLYITGGSTLAADWLTGDWVNAKALYNHVNTASASWGDIPTKVVATSADATGSNILYIVTGS